MTMISRVAILPLLWIALGSPDSIRAASLGRFLGTFTLDAPRAALAKPSASTAYPMPPEGQRQQAMATVSGDFNASILDAYGWRLIDGFKGFAVLEGNPATLRMLYDAPGILEIRPSRSVHPTMDAARRLSRVDGILNWGNWANPQGVSGKGVIVGFADFGFDTHHPAFLDSAGKTRFLAIWDPNLPKEGNAPYGLGQVRNQSQLQADPNFGQNETDMHGTHVASVAAGSGSGNPYYGVAPDSYLLGVNLSTKNKSNSLESNVIYGIQWMFHVADSLKMPCVVNLSLGNQHSGPHDGTSMFDRFIDSLSGPGHIIVGAIGNDGNKKLHAEMTLGAADTLGSFGKLPAIFDMWGEEGKHFAFQVMLMDSASLAYKTSSVFYSTSALRRRPVFDTLLWTDPNTNMQVPIAVTFQTERANPGNRRPHAELFLEATTKDSLADFKGLWVGFRLVGSSKVHVWNAASSPLQSLGIKGFQEGDNNYSLSEIGGTAKSILTVGAYVSKNVYTNHLGVEFAENIDQKVGELAYWSSHGPTLDGRIKPELVAPGRSITGAMSSRLTRPAVWQLPTIVIWPNHAQNQLTGRYLAVQGTSQAAPVAAGAVALLLEMNPKLTPAQVKTILTESAYKDEFTGALAAPNSLWGYGKMDVAAAVQKIRPIPVSGRLETAAIHPKVSARFVQGNLEVTGLEAEGSVAGRIVDWRGRTLSGLKSVRPGRLALTSPLQAGVYIAVLKTARGSYRLRLIKG
ncbi:MAG: S8 family serine peptidase [Fibrobacterota bacterium]|nr:S8 family serine peptidase [Fibrobacterota bacterium]